MGLRSMASESLDCKLKNINPSLNCVPLSNSPQTVVPTLATSASHGTMIEMQMFSLLTPRPTESNILEWVPKIYV